MAAGPSRRGIRGISVPVTTSPSGKLMPSARSPEPSKAFAMASKRDRQGWTVRCRSRSRSIGATEMSGSPPNAALTRSAVASASIMMVSASDEEADGANADGHVGGFGRQRIGEPRHLGRFELHVEGEGEPVVDLAQNRGRGHAARAPWPRR